jgi:hypothetical protein
MRTLREASELRDKRQAERSRESSIMTQIEW